MSEFQPTTSQISYSPPPAPQSVQPSAVTPPPIQSKDEKTLYNSSYSSIFLRNFLAGLGKALGGIILYVIFLAVAGYIFKTYVFPMFEPIFGAFETLGQLQSNPGSTSIPQISPTQMQDLLNALPSEK